ncbi:methyltransferase domain-containing protein [Neorhodopirellula pilleata]|uniref:Arsenite methyltransferase n=1 Tax=Neorhodopirellula pilleata TaxID=2714738 RepID=A0A5C6AI73_9BACT|nr:methyltransferase domain-containing protein [Neorhodopirellula pilleata]TWT98948.1 Demethylmenaquinone methyltransferase [Neorhodopirellula pilleata]
MNTEKVVRERYADAALQREPALCCPVDYDAQYLSAIPQEVIDRDYGCGDPSKHVRVGETVLDLGSGGGKICFIASQVVGPTGQVIGVDLNDEMLSLARKSKVTLAANIGYDNVEFRKGKIQDLAVDRDAVDRFLIENPVKDEMGLRSLEQYLETMRTSNPMIADESIDVVVSNCVLNLVASDEKELLFDEIFRVLRPGGRAVISDIVCDQEVPLEMQLDAELWSGCLSGAFERSAFLEAFEQAGFVDIRIQHLQPEPWQTIDGLAFRSATVIAYRPHLASEGDEVIEQTAEYLRSRDDVRRVYQGPFKYVVDDEGRMYTRGEACEDALAQAAQREAIADQFAVFENSSKSSPAKTTATLPMAGGGCCGGGSSC